MTEGNTVPTECDVVQLLKHRPFLKKNNIHNDKENIYVIQI